MDIEAILDEEYERRKRVLERAIDIAKREWENVRVSLELCGDIGEFSKRDFMIGTIEEDVIIREPLISPTKSVSGYAPTFYPMYFVKNLLAMEERFREHGYKTTEALYVFIEIVTKAAERLGLLGKFSTGFGVGYGRVRTGWIAEKGVPLERDTFFDMFFKGRRIDYDWDFHWTSVRERLKRIFDRFMSWQNDPRLYQREVKPKAKVKPMMV
ncbi:MAG TPA: hypothetical protein VNK81_06010 [Thermodesulfobacteriota bacterium]|nr:hypothetical protein [Thermodesulfobacteriota bacterium]